MTLAHVCDDCDRRVGEFRFVAIVGQREEGEFCSVTCLNAWMVRAGLPFEVPSIEVPKADMPATAAVDKAAAARAALAAKPARKCETCGRVGQRRFTETATGWVCTSHSEQPAAGVEPAPPAAAPTKLPAPAPRDIPAKSFQPNVTPSAPSVPAAPQPQRPAAPGVTARCTDCHLSWTLTGRPLDLAIDMHELKRSHIVQLVESEAATG